MNIVVSGNQKLQFIKSSSITYIESKGHIAIFHCNNEEIRARKNLKDIEERLKDAGFLRAHRSYIVAIDHIKRIEEGWIEMDDEASSEIPLGVVYENSFFEELKKRTGIIL